VHFSEDCIRGRLPNVHDTHARDANGLGKTTAGVPGIQPSDGPVLLVGRGAQAGKAAISVNNHNCCSFATCDWRLRSCSGFLSRIAAARATLSATIGDAEQLLASAQWKNVAAAAEQVIGANRRLRSKPPAQPRTVSISSQFRGFRSGCFSYKGSITSITMAPAIRAVLFK